MTDKRSELDKDAKREKRTEAFENELSDELDKLLREPQHTKWLENALDCDPSSLHAYYLDSEYGSYITKYVGEFYDKHLKDKYGDRDSSKIDESDDFDFGRSFIISDVIEEMAQYIRECIERKTKIKWE